MPPLDLMEILNQDVYKRQHLERVITDVLEDAA